jgi:anti-anti-sigma factor
MNMEVSELGGTGNRVKITLTGRLDSPAVDCVEPSFRDAIVLNGNQTIVDLSQVDFIASLGVRMLLTAAIALGKRGGRLVLYAPTDLVRELLDYVSLSEIIPIRDNEADALEALNA